MEPLLDKIAERERVVAAHAEQVHTGIGQLTVQLREAEQELEHLRITRTTVLSLTADQDGGPAPQPRPEVPDSPAYQQILAAFAEAEGPLRARDLCESLDLGLEPKHIEGMRSKLKRLVGRGILAETEPGLFLQPRP